MIANRAQSLLSFNNEIQRNSEGILRVFELFEFRRGRAIVHQARPLSGASISVIQRGKKKHV